MKCPECGGEHIRKNGHRQHKQNYICVGCGRQFLTEYEPRGYSDDVKRLCLKMYVNGMGVRGISRVTDIAHTTILNWIEQSGERLPEFYDPKQHPQVGELDELETYVGKKQKYSVDLDGGGSLCTGNSGLGGRRPQRGKVSPFVGRDLSKGSVTSSSVMATQSIQASFPTATRLSARPT